MKHRRKRGLLFLFSLSIGALRLGAEARAADLVDVFEGGRDGYPAYRIPALLTTQAGTLLAFAEGRARLGDHAENDLVLKRSVDNGRSWGALQVVAEDGANALNNPTAVGLLRALAPSSATTCNAPQLRPLSTLRLSTRSFSAWSPRRARPSAKASNVPACVVRSAGIRYAGYPSRPPSNTSTRSAARASAPSRSAPMEREKRKSNPLFLRCFMRC